MSDIEKIINDAWENKDQELMKKKFYKDLILAGQTLVYI